MSVQRRVINGLRTLPSRGFFLIVSSFKAGPLSTPMIATWRCREEAENGRHFSQRYTLKCVFNIVLCTYFIWYLVSWTQIKLLIRSCVFDLSCECSYVPSTRQNICLYNKQRTWFIRNYHEKHSEKHTNVASKSFNSCIRIHWCGGWWKKILPTCV